MRGECSGVLAGGFGSERDEDGDGSGVDALGRY